MNTPSISEREEQEVLRAVGVLRSENLVLIPTETFYGIAADPCSEGAVGKLSGIKSRDLGAGIPLIVGSSAVATTLSDPGPPEILELRSLLERAFWPGPLTLVVSASGAKQIAAAVFGPNQTLAIRVSSHPIANRLAAASGGAITATSANPHGEPPPTTYADARAYFPEMEGIDALCGGATKPSTLVLVTKLPFRILREGAITKAQLEAVVGREQVE